MAFIDRIHQANNIDLTRFIPFLVDGEIVGRVPQSHVSELSRLNSLSIASDHITLTAALHDMDLAARSQVFNQDLYHLYQSDSPIMHNKWWGEHYRADTGWGSPIRLLIERAAAKSFGINGYGVHLNGYVKKENAIHLWIATRSADKQTAPGEYDQIVAGGLPAELTPQKAMIKEAQEEANFGEDEIALIRPTSFVSYTKASRYGSRSDNLFVFDAELPADFTPINTDGEVERFDLLPIEEVAELVCHTSQFKFNCSLVIIDFLIRHGVITPEHPDYQQLCMGLRQKIPF